MKTALSLLLTFTILFSAASCLVLVNPKHDNGKHKGWYKNPNNPHNPAHASNPQQKGPENHGNEKKKGK